MMVEMLSDSRFRFLVNWRCFWYRDMFGVAVSNYLKRGRWLKLLTMRHSIFCNFISHTTEIKDNHRLFISCRCNNFINSCLVHPIIVKRKFYVLIGVLSSERLIKLILRWYWRMMDTFNNLKLGMV